MGEIRHYYNGKGQWIRGELLSMNPYRMKLLPLALLGEGWQSYDLWVFDQEGNPVLGHYPAKIQAEEEIIVSLDWIYEYHIDKWADPTGLEPINLIPPVATAEEIAIAKKWASILAVCDLVSNANRLLDDPDTVLKAIRDLVAEPEPVVAKASKGRKPAVNNSETP